MSENFQRVKLNSDGSEQGKPTVNEFYGETPEGGRSGGFRNADALAAAVNDERYANDAAYRSAVSQLVGKTSEGVLAGHQPKYDGRAAEQIEVEREWVTTAMSDPRYASSALYRRQVAEHIARSQSNVRHTSLGNPSGCNRVSMDMNASAAPMGAHSVTVRGEADGSDH